MQVILISTGVSFVNVRLRRLVARSSRLWCFRTWGRRRCRMAKHNSGSTRSWRSKRSLLWWSMKMLLRYHQMLFSMMILWRSIAWCRRVRRRTRLVFVWGPAIGPCSSSNRGWCHCWWDRRMLSCMCSGWGSGFSRTPTRYGCHSLKVNRTFTSTGFRDLFRVSGYTHGWISCRIGWSGRILYSPRTIHLLQCKRVCILLCL